MTVSHIMIMLRKEITEHPSTNLMSSLVYSFQNLLPHSMFNPVAGYTRNEDSLKRVQTMGFGLLQAL